MAYSSVVRRGYSSISVRQAMQPRRPWIARRFGVPVSKGGTFKTVVDGKEVTLKRPYTFAPWTFILDETDKVLHKDTAVDATNDPQKALDLLRSPK